MEKTVGKQSIRFEEAIHLISAASIAGKKEGEGPLGKLFDKISADPCFGMETWEKAESAMQRAALSAALEKGRPSAFPSRRIAPKLGRNGRASHEIGGKTG